MSDSNGKDNDKWLIWPEAATPKEAAEQAHVNGLLREAFNRKEHEMSKEEKLQEIANEEAEELANDKAKEAAEDAAKEAADEAYKDAYKEKFSEVYYEVYNEAYASAIERMKEEA